MNTHLRNSRATDGKILIVTLFVAAAIGLVLMSVLSLIKSQNLVVARSQCWNQCIPVLEAGVEEALAHLNNKKESTLAVNGWTQNGEVYSLYRVVGPDSFCLVNLIMTNTRIPVIVCTGYVRLPALVASVPQEPPLLAAAGVNVGGDLYIVRTVRVIAAQQPIFAKAMVARDKIDMNGNNITTDSYDSSNPLYSTPNGTYDPLKARDHGDVATSSGLANAISVGNANIKGRLRTGHGGTASVGANGSVGDMAWVNAGTRGIKKGWFSDDMNVYFDPPQRPSTSGSLGMPSGGSVGTTNYACLLNSGLYVMSSLNIDKGGKVGVIGDARLIVDGIVNISGGLDILPGGSLTVWVAGPTITIGGHGVNNTRRSTNFVLYGMSTVTSVELPSNGDFNGALYCPTATMQLNGGGSADVNFCGACVMGTIKMNGHYKFHYDEALGAWGPPDKFVIINWVEL